MSWTNLIQFITDKASTAENNAENYADNQVSGHASQNNPHSSSADTNHGNGAHSSNFLQSSNYNPESDTHSRYSDSEAASAAPVQSVNGSTGNVNAPNPVSKKLVDSIAQDTGQGPRYYETAKLGTGTKSQTFTLSSTGDIFVLNHFDLYHEYKMRDGGSSSTVELRLEYDGNTQDSTSLNGGQTGPNSRNSKSVSGSEINPTATNSVLNSSFSHVYTVPDNQTVEFVIEKNWSDSVETYGATALYELELQVREIEFS